VRKCAQGSGSPRLAVRDHLGLDRIECKKVNVSSIVAGEHAENEIRKDFTISERVAIARAMEAEIGNRQGERTDLKGDGELVEKIPQVESGEKTRVIAARKAGFGNETTYRQAAKAVDKGVPELIDAMDGLTPAHWPRLAESGGA